MLRNKTNPDFLTLDRRLTCSTPPPGTRHAVLAVPGQHSPALGGLGFLEKCFIISGKIEIGEILNVPVLNDVFLLVRGWSREAVHVRALRRRSAVGVVGGEAQAGAAGAVFPIAADLYGILTSFFKKFLIFFSKVKSCLLLNRIP